MLRGSDASAGERDCPHRKCKLQMLLPGLRSILTETSVGQCFFLLCGLPPFLRVTDLRAKNRGDL